MAITSVNEEVVAMAVKFIRAYLECADELQTHVKAMVDVIKTSDDEQEIRLARHTIGEILFPEMTSAGVSIEHLDECAEAEQADGADARRELDDEEATFAERLQSHLERLHLTQAELARKIGVGQSAISMMLKRKCRPQRSTVEKLAEALNVRFEELWPARGKSK